MNSVAWWNQGHPAHLPWESSASLGTKGWVEVFAFPRAQLWLMGQLCASVVSVVLNIYTEMNKVPLNTSFSAQLMSKLCGSGVRISSPSGVRLSSPDTCPTCPLTWAYRKVGRGWSHAPSPSHPFFLSPLVTARRRFWHTSLYLSS